MAAESNIFGSNCIPKTLQNVCFDEAKAKGILVVPDWPN